MSRKDWDIEAYKIQARLARVMGHPIRLRILFLLEMGDRDLTSTELIEDLEISKASLSQHLTKMSSVGLIRTLRSGRFLHVRMANPAIGKACLLVREALLMNSEEQTALLESADLESQQHKSRSPHSEADTPHP